MNWVTEILQKDVDEEDRIIDVGCGIFMITDGISCKSILGIDIWTPYLDLKKDQFQTIKFDIANPNNFKIFIDNSYDVITCLDVIEHLEKDKGLALIKELKRIARKKVVIFTPEGFVEQSDGLAGSWGENNPIYQKHRSGWTTEELKSLGFETSLFNDVDHNQVYAVFKKDK
jgi:ubiquinone/menaquinone biosynthesis C-methylase UbiE